MRYASIREFDVSNGENIGVSLFVQGCDKVPHCKNCFNPSTWNFDGGKEWNEKTKELFLELINRPYIKRVSILGGEPLSMQNCDEIYKLCSDIKKNFPDKKIWIYSGYKYEDISSCHTKLKTISCADILVDGEYIDEQKDISINWRGSRNQRVIDIKKTLSKNQIVLYCN